MKKKMLALAAAGVMAVGLAACGGDDDGDDTGSETTAAISEADFVEQGNAICAAGNEELSGGPEDGDIEGYVTDTLVPSIQGQIDDIRALGAPEGQEEQVTTFLDDAQAALDGLEADPASIAEDTFSDVNDQAVELGLDECAG